MSVSCYAGLDGRVFRIYTLENEEMVISSYFLAGFTSQPDLGGLATTAGEPAATRPLWQISAKKEAPIGGKGVRFAPLTWSALAKPAEQLAAVDIQCSENTFKLADFGIVGLNCASRRYSLGFGRGDKPDGRRAEQQL